MKAHNLHDHTNYSHVKTGTKHENGQSTSNMICSQYYHLIPMITVLFHNYHQTGWTTTAEQVNLASFLFDDV